SAAFFSRDGGIAEAPAMLVPRAAHVCIALSGNTILVAGGQSGPGGPTNAAELFDPSADGGKGRWSTTGAMLTARTGAASILLKDGRALIAGGETSGRIADSLEIYDPSTGRFRFARGVLSSPRSNQAIAVLNDGHVLIAGGSDGANVLSTID